MAFLDTLKSLVGIELEDEEFDEEEEEQSPKEVSPASSGKFTKKAYDPKPVQDTILKNPYVAPNPDVATASKVAPMASSMAAARAMDNVNSRPASSAVPAAGNTSRYGTREMKMVVIEPLSFDESPRLVDSLKAKKPIIINLENVETDVARKIFDFLSGATYALNGNVQKISNNIFVFAPENVDIAYNQNQRASEQMANLRNPWR